MTRGRRGAAATLLAVTLVAGCGGGGETPNDVLQNKLDSYSALSDQIYGDGTAANPGLVHTSVTNMPTSGTATFVGQAGVIVGRSTDPELSAVLFGDATVTADFDTSTLTGSATNFYGARTNPITGDPVEPVGAYSGTLALSSGCIGATACSGTVSNPYEAAAVVGGSLSRDGHSIGVSTPVTGEIRGNPAPKAIELEGYGTAVIDGGTGYLSAVSILGKKQ